MSWSASASSEDFLEQLGRDSGRVDGKGRMLKALCRNLESLEFHSHYSGHSGWLLSLLVVQSKVCRAQTAQRASERETDRQTDRERERERDEGGCICVSVKESTDRRQCETTVLSFNVGRRRDCLEMHRSRPPATRTLARRSTTGLPQLCRQRAALSADAVEHGEWRRC